MNQFTQNTIRQVLDVMWKTMKQAANLPEDKARKFTNDMGDLFAFFLEMIPERNMNDEKPRIILDQVRVAIDALMRTGIMDTVILRKSILTNDMHVYETYCSLAKKHEPETDEMLAALSNDWVSPDRTYRVIDAYSAIARKKSKFPLPKAMLDPGYTDEQVQAIWYAINDWHECMMRGFDIMSYVTTDMTASTIKSTIMTAGDLIRKGTDPTQDMGFLKKPNAMKWVYGPTVKFIITMNASCPIPVGWEEITPTFLPEAVMVAVKTDISKSRNVNGDDKMEQAKSRQRDAEILFDMWDGFTVTLDNYYRNKHISKPQEIYEAWRRDISFTGMNGDQLAIALNTVYQNRIYDGSR